MMNVYLPAFWPPDWCRQQSFWEPLAYGQCLYSDQAAGLAELLAVQVRVVPSPQSLQDSAWMTALGYALRNLHWLCRPPHFCLDSRA